MSKHCTASIVLDAILCLLLPVGTALAQTAVGGVKGTVKDPAAAVVPGATVTLLSTETNTSRKIESNGDGLYDFPDVPPGTYQLTVEKTGFKKWSGDLVLQVQQIAVVDANLVVGNTAETVDVTAITPVIATESSSLAGVADSARIREVPLNGMDITLLFQLIPGVEVGSYSPHVNGLPAGAADVLQDGSSIYDRQRGGLPRINPGLDSIQEFSVDMNSTAQYSHPSTITLVTKGGTNALHGSVFDKFRNNADGLRARMRQDGNTPAPYKRNEFGASAGGPVLLPKLYNGKDKTFWFFSYQGNRIRQYQSVATDVPTQAMWNGDFSNLVDAQGNLYTIYDPNSTAPNGTRTAFPGNQIPGGLAGSNKLYQYLAANTPRPTNNVDPLAGVNYYATASNPQNNNQYTGKIDHHITDRDYLSFRFSVSNSNAYNYLGYGPAAPNYAYNYTGDVEALYNGAISYTHTFSPNVINEFLFAGQRSVSTYGGGQDNTFWDAQLGLSNPLNESGWPTLTGGNVNDNYEGRFIWDSDNKSPAHLNMLIPEDNLTIVRGKHEIKVGARFSDERNNTRSAQQGQGRYGFNGDATALWDPVSQNPVSYTGNGQASMMLGLGNYYRVNYNRPYYYIRQAELGLYAQDSWKVTPRFTLNYGLRWDYWTPYNESSDRMFAMDMSKWQTTQQLITPGSHDVSTLGIPGTLLTAYENAGMSFSTANQANYPSTLFNSDKGDFSPRFGAAFKLNDKTVLRGGYGMYYWTVPGAQMLLQQGLSAPMTLDYVAEPDYWHQINYYDVFSPPIPGERVGDPNMVDINSPQTVQGPFPFAPFDKNWKNARAQEWNFTIEREISPMTSLRLSYIGNHGSQEMQSVQMNAQQSQYLYVTQTGQPLPANYANLRVNPFWDDLDYRTPIGYSNGNSLQINVERRSYKGLQFQWYYVFSRNLGNADASQGYASQPGPIVPDAVTLPNGGTLAQRQAEVYSNIAGIPKHEMNWNLIYDLPFGRGKFLGKNARGFLNQAIGNWQLATIGYWHTGQWLTPQNTTTGNPYLPNLQMVRNPILSGSQQKVINFQGTNQLLYFAGNFDPTGTGLTNYQPALIIPGPNQDGYVPVQLKSGTTVNVPYDVYNSMGTNFIQGPRNWGMDASLFKTFKFTETKVLRFTADAFNVLNHPNDLNPNSTTGLIDLSQSANDPRIIQFSLRLDF
jgi:hypothetical protein